MSHPDHIPGYDLKTLGNQVARLRYDRTKAFLKAYIADIEDQAEQDAENGRSELSALLLDHASTISNSLEALDNAWAICAPRMKAELAAQAEQEQTKYLLRITLSDIVMKDEDLGQNWLTYLRNLIRESSYLVFEAWDTRSIPAQPPHCIISVGGLGSALELTNSLLNENYISSVGIIDQNHQAEELWGPAPANSKYN